MNVIGANPSASSLTVQRGVDGTTAATHTANANVYVVSDQRGFVASYHSSAAGNLDVGADQHTALPTVQFGVAGETLDESAGSFSITVSLSAAATQTVTVPFSLGGTAQNGADYSLQTSNPLTIPAGSTAVTINGTLYPDRGPSKTLSFTLGSPTGATLGTNQGNTLTITRLTSVHGGQHE